MIGLALTAALAHDPTVPAVTVGRGTVQVDGDLSDEAWASASPIEGFRRFRPVDGGAPPGETAVRLLHDEHHLYVAIRVRGAEEPVRARISPREDINDDDQIGVYLDPFDDAQNGFVFYVNARGIQQDIRAEGPSFDGWNFAWDTVLHTEGRVTDDRRGYDLEIAIPWRSLKYPGGGEEQTWGLLVTRKIPGDGSKFSWPKMDRNAPRIFPQAAPIRLSPPPRGSGVELIPGVAGVITARRPTPEAPLDVQPPRPERVPSLDMRFGVSPSTGLGATINPDFSQVEFDETPIDLNLRFPFAFSERRPFFLDGAGYLADDVETLWSRTIVAPLYAVKAYSQSDAWQVGALNALDARPSESVNQGGSPGFGSLYDDRDDLADALALSSVLRVSRNVGEGGHVAAVGAQKDVIRGGRVEGKHLLGGADVSVPVGDAFTAGVIAQGSYTTDFDDTVSGLDVGGGLDWQSDTQVSLYGWHTTPGFRRETGIHYTAGKTGLYGEVGHMFEPGFVDVMQPWLTIEAESTPGYRYAAAGGGDWWQKGAAQGSFGGAVRQEEVDGADAPVPGGYGWVEGSAILGAPLSVSGEAGMDRGWVWGHGPGANGWLWLGFTARPTPGVRADVSWEGQHTGEKPLVATWETSQRWRGRVTWQFTRALGMRVVEEYVSYGGEDAGAPRLTSSLLFTALRNPGTAVYVGYAERTDVVTGKALDRTAFAKATVLLRL